MNEYVGYSEPDKQYDAQLVFSISLYMYHSYIFIFILKESTTVTTDKQRTKRIQQKNVQKCGGQFAPNSV